MSKKIKLAIALCLMFGLFVFAAVVSHATAAATTAAIAVTVTQDNGTTAVTSFSTGNIAVKNSAGETLDQSLDYLISSSSNVYTVSNLVYKDTYYIAFSSGSTTVTVSQAITAFSATAKAARMKWSSSDTYASNKSGVISGLLVDSSGDPLAGATVKAVLGTVTYQSTSATTTGAYKIFCPAGSYKFIVVGKDGSTDYKNINQTVKVTAGQASGPMSSSSGETAWGTDSSTNALVVSTIDPAVKRISGTAVKNSTVYTYVYEPTNPIVYRYLNSKKVTGTATATTAAFAITLTEYPANKKIAVIAKDLSDNSYEDSTYESTAVDKLTVTSITADSTNATIVNAIDVSFVDAVSANLYRNITSISTTYNGTSVAISTSAAAAVAASGSTGSDALVSISSDDYTLAATKITFKVGTLSTAQAYTFRIVATGYNDIYVQQTVSASATIPPTSISGTFTVATGGGTVPGSAKFSVIGTAGTGNALVYKVTSSSANTIYLGNTLTDYTVLAANTNITGVDATNNKYIQVVEISSPAAAVVKLRKVTLTAAQIKVPSILSKTVSGTSLVMITDATMNTTGPATSYFTVLSGTSGTTSNAVTGVTVSSTAGSRKITLTLTNAVTSTQSVNIRYTVPTTNPLKDENGNKVAAISATANNVLNCGGGPTYTSATAASTTVVVTMSEAVTAGGTLSSAFNVYVDGTAATVSNATVEGQRVIITIGTTLAGGETVVTDFIPTSTNYLKDANDEKAPAFSESIVAD